MNAGIEVSYVFIFLVKVTDWPPVGKIAAHSAYEMFSWFKYLIVGLVFSHLGFWSGNLFLIAPFPDLCLLVPFGDETTCQIVKQAACAVSHSDCSKCYEIVYGKKTLRNVLRIDLRGPLSWGFCCLFACLIQNVN